MSDTHVVQKSFPGPNGYQFKSGERVNASGWRNVDTLVTHRYLKPIQDEPKPKGNRIQQAAQVAKEVADGNQST